MPINKKMMKNLKKQYGSKKGKDVYYALEMKRKKKNKNGSITRSAMKNWR